VAAHERRVGATRVAAHERSTLLVHTSPIFTCLHSPGIALFMKCREPCLKRPLNPPPPSPSSRVPGLPIRDCAVSPNNLVLRRSKLSSRHISFILRHCSQHCNPWPLLPAWQSVAKFTFMLSAPTTPSLTLQLFLSLDVPVLPFKLFPGVAHEFLRQHDPISNLGESWYPPPVPLPPSSLPSSFLYSLLSA